MVMLIPSDDNAASSDLHLEVLALCESHGVVSDESPAVRQRYAEHLKYRQSVLDSACASGYEIEDHGQNEFAELFIYIHKDGQRLCYLSKEWREPLFRIGQYVKIPLEQRSVVQACYDRLSSFCSARGIVTTLSDDADVLNLGIEAVLPVEGFNADTFSLTVTAVDDCLREIARLMPSDGLYGCRHLR